MKDFDWLSCKDRARTAVLLALLLGFGISISASPLRAARTVKPSSGPTAPVEITVSVLPLHGQQAPAVAMSDLTIAQGRARDDVVSWIPAQGEHAGLELLVLIDNSDRITKDTNQLPDLRAFILQQPPTTLIGVGYMYNGVVYMEQSLTADHNAAAKAVHLSASVGTASPYFSLMEMNKRGQLPANPKYPRREVLMFTDGSDPYAGPFIEDPYVGYAISDMQRAGIQVFSIFVPGKFTEDSGYRGGTLLAEMSEPTGGYALYAGLTGTAVSFTPYLTDLTYILQHQYLLGFQAHQEKTGDLQRVKITSAVPNAMLLVPAKVYVPGVEDKD